MPVPKTSPQKTPGAAAEAPSPVDLDGLRRRTFGDAALEREVIGLFLDSLPSLAQRLAASSPEARAAAAHRLAGSARGIGADRLADLAAVMQQAAAGDMAPVPGNAIEEILREVERVTAFLRQRSSAG
jgi:HPt (histidine-containing phosphotransfer) domain-containing protein